jgi:multiple sugar transport system substrate-binding protein
MRNRNKILTAAAVGAVFTLALGGCTNSENGSTSSGESGSTSNGDVTTLTFWSYYTAGSQAEWLAAQVKKFETDNPDIKIDVIETVGDQQDQKLLASVATGRGPDLFINNIVVDFPTLAAAGVFADLTPYWEKFADADEFPEASVWKDGDTVYNLLPYTNLLGMYYNLDILGEYGITEPPATLEELQADMEVVTADGKYKGLALSGAPSVEGAWLFAPQLLGEGINYCNFDGPKVGEAFNRLDSWASDGFIPKAAATWDQNASWQQFMTGKYAFAFNGNWQLGGLEDVAFKYGTAQYPKPEDGFSQVYPGGEGYGIGSQSEHPDLAWKFLEQAILTPEAADAIFTATGSIPTRADATDSAALQGDFVKPFVTAASDPGSWPKNENTAKMQNALGTEVSSVISGQKTGDEGAQAAIKNIADAAAGGGC